jgi:uncharacterized membrane protein/protein-disulfide isomerase
MTTITGKPDPASGHQSHYPAISQDRPPRWTLALLAGIVGMLLSAYALWEYVMAVSDPAHVSFCSISASISCDAVARSAWSTIFGIPIASYGVLSFFVMVVLVAGPPLCWIKEAVFLLSFLGLIGSVVLFYISKIVIGVVCPVCLLVYGCWLALAVLTMPWCKSQGVGRSLLRGVTQIAEFPTRLVGLHADGPPSAYLFIGTITGLVVGFVSASVPVFYQRPTGSSNSAVVAMRERAVDDWSRGPERRIPDVSEGPARDYFSGPDSAPITLVEYADFECPACHNMYWVVEEILKQYQGKIRYSLRNFPFDQSCNALVSRPMHKHACVAAMFARCAGAQGKYYESARALYSVPEIRAAQQDPEVVRVILRQAVINVGVDPVVLDACVASNEQKEAIDRDVTTADSLGLEGTPFIWINGKQIKRPTELALRAVIEKILNP